MVYNCYIRSEIPKGTESSLAIEDVCEASEAFDCVREIAKAFEHAFEGVGAGRTRFVA
jgi:hypothetical protein